ncbi:MAG TPA: inositol monophosphatase family protein [Solirubrobacteraceae bacterium]|nr:inositol monophosphatase family protein [Solirubrobacteraceae bacterium]
MTVSTDVLAADWLALCRRAGEGVRALLDSRPTSAERVLETGTTGEGGDRTLLIDEEAESIVFAELERLYAEGHRFSAISEERGAVSFGDERVRVVIDPIDGSLNAKRGLPHHALSIAVADGPTMADVRFGYVLDFGPSEEWWARSGGGAFLDGEPIEALPERRTDDGRLEIVAIESASPRPLAAAIDELVPAVRRVRAIGSIAVSLCQLAATRVDGMASLRSCRGVDAAAAQLIVRESGGLVAFPAMADPLGAPLGVEAPSGVVAARTPEALELMSRLPRV